jgi:hypothetical protein
MIVTTKIEGMTKEERFKDFILDTLIKGTQFLTDGSDKYSVKYPFPVDIGIGPEMCCDLYISNTYGIENQKEVLGITNKYFEQLKKVEEYVLPM